MTIATRLAAFAIVLGVASHARAQSADATAETQFREGKRLMSQGNIAEACKRFEASEHAEPAVGTELNLADCYAKNHQTASAWAMFITAGRTAKHAHDAKREHEARERADALQPQLIYLTIAVPDDHKVPGLVIKRNGAPLDEGLWNQNDPVDPDTYTITAGADGYATWEVNVAVRTKNRRVEVPVLDKQAGGTAVVAATVATPPPPAQDHSETHWRKGPLALAVVGLVGVGAGIGLGAASQSAQNSANAACMNSFSPDPLACNGTSGLSLNSRARSEAIAADIGFGIGGVALATAVIWWFVAGPTTTEHFAIVPSLDGHVGVAAMGRF